MSVLFIPLNRLNSFLCLGIHSQICFLSLYIVRKCYLPQVDSNVGILQLEEVASSVMEVGIDLFSTRSLMVSLIKYAIYFQLCIRLGWQYCNTVRLGLYLDVLLWVGYTLVSAMHSFWEKCFVSTLVLTLLVIFCTLILFSKSFLLHESYISQKYIYCFGMGCLSVGHFSFV